MSAKEKGKSARNEVRTYEDVARCDDTNIKWLQEKETVTAQDINKEIMFVR